MSIEKKMIVARRFIYTLTFNTKPFMCSLLSYITIFTPFNVHSSLLVFVRGYTIQCDVVTVINHNIIKVRYWLDL